MSANCIRAATGWLEVTTLTSLLEMTVTTISATCGPVSAALLTLLAALPDPALLLQREASTYLRSTADVLRISTRRGEFRRVTICSPRREAL